MILNMWARLSLLLCVACALQAQLQMNVEQLADFIRSELALRQHNDKQIAIGVRKIQLTEKLTDKTIIDLEAQGVGPKTVEALKALRDESAKLKPPATDATYSPATAADQAAESSSPPTPKLSATAPPIPPPDSIRQQRILDSMKQYAMNYTQNLPNFFCVEVTRKYVDPNAGDHYRSIGTVLAKVSYNGGAEHYNVYSVNGKLQDTTMEGAGGGGAVSTGEFGSLMREIFEPNSQAEFNWDHWATLRGRRMAVFNYFIDSGHSQWSISYGADKNDEQRIVTAYRGLAYADPNTGEISRIKFIAVDIPRTFPVSATTETLDYDLVDISNQKYVVPLRAQLLMNAGRETAKNEMEFRNYRKFGTESTIKYELDPNAPPPLPESKTEEQALPAKAPAPAKPTSPWTLPSAPPPPPQ
jgi:hypothetical protein